MGKSMRQGDDMQDASEEVAEDSARGVGVESSMKQGKAKIWTRDFVLIALINMTVFMGFYITNTGMPVYVSMLGASDVIVGLVTTLTTATAIIIRPFSGIMIDRFGRKGILLTSLSCMTVIIVAYAVFPLIGVLLSLRVLHGFAWGLGSTATSTIAADSIPRSRFAEGMGYFALTNAIASAIAPALALILLQNIGIEPMIAAAALSTAISLVLVIAQKTRSQVVGKPSLKSQLKLSDLFDRRALLPACIMGLINTAFAAITTFIALHGQEQGVDNVFLYFTVYAVVTIISRPIIGRVIDKTGYFGPGVLSILGVVITLVIIAFADNLMWFCAAGVFAGLGIGAAMGTFQAMAIAAVPSERRGVATSTFLFGFDGGIAMGALIAGTLSGIGGYSVMYLAMTVFPLIACAVIFIAGKKRIARYSPDKNSER